MSIDEKRVGDIARDHREVIYLKVPQAVNNMNPTSPTQVRWLYYPQVLFRFFLRQHFKVSLKLSSLVRQYVGVRDDIVDAASAELLLHLHNVMTKTILSRDLEALREMIYSLILVQALIEERLA